MITTQQPPTKLSHGNSAPFHYPSIARESPPYARASVHFLSHCLLGSLQKLTRFCRGHSKPEIPKVPSAPVLAAFGAYKALAPLNAVKAVLQYHRARQLRACGQQLAPPKNCPYTQHIPVPSSLAPDSVHTASQPLRRSVPSAVLPLCRVVALRPQPSANTLTPAPKPAPKTSQPCVSVLRSRHTKPPMASHKWNAGS